MKIFNLNALFKLPDDFNGDEIEAIKLMSSYLETAKKENKIITPVFRHCSEREYYAEFQDQVENEGRSCFFTYNFFNFEKDRTTDEILEDNKKIIETVPCLNCKAKVGENCKNSRGNICENPHGIRIALYEDYKNPLAKHSSTIPAFVDGCLTQIHKKSI